MWGLLVVEAQIVTPCGYSDSTAGASGAVLLFAGVLSSFLVGGLMEATKAYLPLQRGVAGASLLAIVFFAAARRSGNRRLLLLSFAAAGVALQPFMPVTLEHAAEMTFPVGADVSASVLFVLANVWSAILVLITTSQLASSKSLTCDTVLTPFSATLVVGMLVAFALTWALKKDYKRSGVEHGGTLRNAFPESEGDLTAPLVNPAEEGLAYGATG